MIFKEYCKPFGGDFLTEGRNLLGDQVREFSALQDALGEYPNLYTYEEHLQHVRAFYSIAVTTGVRELNVRIDPHSEWIAHEISNSLQGELVVDVGCCDGLFTVFYALNYPFSRFTGIDLSEEALKWAQQRAEQLGVRNIQWVCGNILDAQIREYLNDADTIIFQDVLYQILGGTTSHKEQRILKEVASHQKQGSIVIITQEGNKIQGFHLGGKIEEYALANHATKTLFDKNIGTTVPYEVAILRKVA